MRDTGERVPGQGAPQGAAFCTNFGASVPPRCPAQPYRGFLALRPEAFRGIYSPESHRLLNGLLNYCSCCGVLFIQTLLTIRVCAVTLQKCQASRRSGCAGRTSSIDTYLSVQVEPLLSVQSPSPTSPSFQSSDSPAPSEDLACSHADKSPNTDVSFTLSELNQLKG